MKKIKKQLLILLATTIIAGSGLTNIPNPNNLNNPGESPIGATDSGEKEDTHPNNGGDNTGTDKQDCDKENKPFSK